MKITFSNITFYIFILTLISCSLQVKINTEQNEVTIITAETKQKSYSGWWVYGEGQHIFKDEKSLEEFNLEFPNENMEDLKILYLAVCEMEYFPMECSMKGYIKTNVLKNQKTLIVSDFNILYIEGCEEN